LRYAVFKAQLNQKWAVLEKQEFQDLCDEYELEPEQFFRDGDNPNRKWSYAVVRLKRFIDQRNIMYYI